MEALLFFLVFMAAIGSIAFIVTLGVAYYYLKDKEDEL